VFLRLHENVLHSIALWKFIVSVRSLTPVLLFFLTKTNEHCDGFSRALVLHKPSDFLFDLLHVVRLGVAVIERVEELNVGLDSLTDVGWFDVGISSFKCIDRFNFSNSRHLETEGDTTRKLKPN